MIIQKSCRNLLAFPEPLCTCCVVGNMATIATINFMESFVPNRTVLHSCNEEKGRYPQSKRSSDCEWSREELENILWKWRIV
jgi:hypothetical protein